MTTINLPSTLQSIGMLAFCECGKLTSIVIPSKVKTIPHAAFQGCEGLKSLTIPASVTSIERMAFLREKSGGIANVFYGSSKANWTALMKKATTAGYNNGIVNAKSVVYNFGVKYTVTFNGGSPKTIKVENGKKISTVIKTLPTIKKKGYTFKGWYTAKTGGTKVTTNTVITKTVTFEPHWTKVTVGQTTINKLTPKSKSFTVTYKKVNGAKGYEIRYSKKSNMSGATKALSTSTSATIKKLSAKKKYYVQVYAYKLDSTNAKIYSKASVKKNVTTK